MITYADTTIQANIVHIETRFYHKGNQNSEITEYTRRDGFWFKLLLSTENAHKILEFSKLGRYIRTATQIWQLARETIPGFHLTSAVDVLWLRRRRWIPCDTKLYNALLFKEQYKKSSRSAGSDYWLTLINAPCLSILIICSSAENLKSATPIRNP